MVPVAKERFEKVVAGSEGTMVKMTESPQLELPGVARAVVLKNVLCLFARKTKERTSLPYI